MKQENLRLLESSKREINAKIIDADRLLIELKKSMLSREQKKHFTKLLNTLENMLKSTVDFYSFIGSYLDSKEDFGGASFYMHKINDYCNLIQTSLNSLKFENELKMGAVVRESILSEEGVYGEVVKINQLRYAGEKEAVLKPESFSELSDKLDQFIAMLYGRFSK